MPHSESLPDQSANSQKKEKGTDKAWYYDSHPLAAEPELRIKRLEEELQIKSSERLQSEQRSARLEEELQIEFSALHVRSSKKIYEPNVLHVRSSKKSFKL